MHTNLKTGRFLLLALLAALFPVCLLSLGLGGGFMLDDSHVIVSNPLVHMQAVDRDSLMVAAAGFRAGGSTRPLAMMSFALDYWRGGGLDAATFKATNLAIHALTTFFLALFFRRLLVLARCTEQHATITALLMALVWAIHPLQVSSVLYVVQRMQTLATLFLVVALWAYLGLRRAQMAGRRGWPHGVLMTVCWLLAIASKEDAVLLPAYCLLLELTVLRFAAAQPWREHSLRRFYLVMALAGIGLYVFWALPHYWSTEAYAGRDFNSAERLLTQARVLVMYLGQIVLPLPGLMQFNYDTLAISRGLLMPATTLLAMLLLLGLLAWAWLWRTLRPLFTLGVLLFFAGHFISSNAISLELVFEHRNHFPMIGAVLALGDLLVSVWQRWKPRPAWSVTILGVLVLAFGTMGAIRAHLWGDPIRLAQHHVDINPKSSRAWLTLGGNYFDLAGRQAGKDSPWLDQAIRTVEDAATATASPSAYSNVVIYKTIQGTATQADWDRLLQRLEVAPMTPPTRNTLWTTVTNLQAGIGLDEAQALRVIDIIARRAHFTPAEYLRIGVMIYTQTANQESALPYFVRAAKRLPPQDSSILRLSSDLRDQGREEWAQIIEQANTEKQARTEADS